MFIAMILNARDISNKKRLFKPNSVYLSQSSVFIFSKKLRHKSEIIAFDTADNNAFYAAENIAFYALEHYASSLAENIAFYAEENISFYAEEHNASNAAGKSASKGAEFLFFAALQEIVQAAP